MDFNEFYLWFARQDADAFAHLMSRGAHKQVAGWVVFLGLALFLPGVAILAAAGPDPTVRARAFSHAARSTAAHSNSAACTLSPSRRTRSAFLRACWPS